MHNFQIFIHFSVPKNNPRNTYKTRKTVSPIGNTKKSIFLKNISLTKFYGAKQNFRSQSYFFLSRNQPRNRGVPYNQMKISGKKIHRAKKQLWIGLSTVIENNYQLHIIK